MRETPNLSLKLPDSTDYVLVEDLNENFTKLDTEIAKITDEENGVEAKLTKHLDNDAIHKTSETIRTESTTALRTEVVNSLPTSNLDKGRIVFLDDAEAKFKGYDGGKWV